MKTLVFLEQRDGKIKSASFEAAVLASKVAGGDRSKVAAVVVGDGPCEQSAEEIKKFGVGKLYTVLDGNLNHYNVMTYTSAVEQAIKDFDPQHVIAGATPMGRDIMPRLAMRCEGGLITDATDVNIEGNQITAALKPMYAGKVIANVAFKKDGIRFLSIRQNSFPIDEADGDIEKSALTATATNSELITTKEVRKGSSDKADLTEASFIISGGRSLASADNFKILNEAADVIGATVGASRAAVDSGFAPHEMQVGQTGKTVNPSLYIACGISGSIQHMAGMRTSKVIVAINTDPEAPIFGVADYGIVADLFEAVPLLTEGFKKLMS